MNAIHPRRTGMVATLGGLLALPLGLLILLLPLLATELSRPRDSAWGAVLLLLALVLVTSAERLSGAPMLGVLCGALLIGRLGSEVALGRWRQLSEEEQRRLGSLERWSTSFRQLGATLAGGASQLGNMAAGLGQGLLEGRSGASGAAGAAPDGATPAGRGGGRSRGKLWVRPEAEPGQEPETSTGQPGDERCAVATAAANRTDQPRSSGTPAPIPSAAAEAVAPQGPEPTASPPTPSRPAGAPAHEPAQAASDPGAADALATPPADPATAEV